ISVSYGQVPRKPSCTIEFIGGQFGRSNIGGAAIQLGFAHDEVVEEGNGSTRMLDRVLVNGEVIYSTKKQFANSGGTHIVITEAHDAMAGKTTTSQYLHNFAKRSRPHRVTTVEREGFTKETLYYDGFGYFHSNRQGEVLFPYTRNQW